MNLEIRRDNQQNSDLYLDEKCKARFLITRVAHATVSMRRNPCGLVDSTAMAVAIAGYGSVHRTERCQLLIWHQRLQGLHWLPRLRVSSYTEPRQLLWN